MRDTITELWTLYDKATLAADLSESTDDLNKAADILMRIESVTRDRAYQPLQEVREGPPMYGVASSSRP